MSFFVFLVLFYVLYFCTIYVCWFDIMISLRFIITILMLVAVEIMMRYVSSRSDSSCSNHSSNSINSRSITPYISYLFRKLMERQVIIFTHSLISIKWSTHMFLDQINYSSSVICYITCSFTTYDTKIALYFGVSCKISCRIQFIQRCVLFRFHTGRFYP